MPAKRKIYNWRCDSCVQFKLRIPVRVAVSLWPFLGCRQNLILMTCWEINFFTWLSLVEGGDGGMLGWWPGFFSFPIPFPSPSFFPGPQVGQHWFPSVDGQRRWTQLINIPSGTRSSPNNLPVTPLTTPCQRPCPLSIPLKKSGKTRRQSCSASICRIEKERVKYKKTTAQLQNLLHWLKINKFVQLMVIGEK